MKALTGEHRHYESQYGDALSSNATALKTNMVQWF